jgi:glyoxylase-like metal-dependent hydrolase (beta-lactamase superfamily II)
MALIDLAPGVQLVPSRPPFAFNVYVVDGVLVDAGTRWAHRRIRRAVRGTRLHAHAITHAHADHQGSSARLCAELGLPFWAPADEVAYAESGDLRATFPVNAVTRFQRRFWAGPGLPVDRALREGDEVGSFTVLETPGHSPGHISLWRESDRVLVGGDVAFNQDPFGRARLEEPPAVFTLDAERNRASLQRIADLRPAVALFGHGPAVRDPGRLADLAARASAGRTAVVHA